MEIKENYPLKQLNTFGIDAMARYYVAIESNDELKKLIGNGWLKRHPYYILGGGSNILFTGDFSGILLKLQTKQIVVEEASDEEVLVRAEAGVDWNDLVSFCIDNEFGGLENLILIPGNVGAAPIQNIGAYGIEQEQVFYELKAVDLSDGKESIFSKQQCEFGYRDSIFKNELKGKYLITEVTYKLSRKYKPHLEYAPLKEAFKNQDPNDINLRKISEVVAGIRRSKLPDPRVTGNAGSFFKNPVINEKDFLKIKEEYPTIPGYKQEDRNIKVPAGWLIEQCGWKGKRVGETGVHEKQALVLVNYGKSSGKNILDLSEQIAADVHKSFGICLKREVNVV